MRKVLIAICTALVLVGVGVGVYFGVAKHNKSEETSYVGCHAYDWAEVLADDIAYMDSTYVDSATIVRFFESTVKLDTYLDEFVPDSLVYPVFVSNMFQAQTTMPDGGTVVKVVYLTHPTVSVDVFPETEVDVLETFAVEDDDVELPVVMDPVQMYDRLAATDCEKPHTNFAVLRHPVDTTNKTLWIAGSEKTFYVAVVVETGDVIPYNEK